VADTVARLFETFGITFVSGSATSPVLSDSVSYKGFIRTTISDNTQAKVQAAVAAYFEWQLLAIIYSDDLYGSGGYKAWQAAIEDINKNGLNTQSVYNNSGSIKLILKCKWVISETKEKKLKEVDNFAECLKKYKVQTLVMYSK
jgi:hypothetical protein